MIEKTVIISDIHLPHHDPKAVSTMFNFVKGFKPHKVIIAGDMMDFSGISRHADASAANRIKSELAVGNAFLDELRKVAGAKCEIVMLGGNHDKRIRSFVELNAPQLEGMLTIEEELRLEERGISFTEYSGDKAYWLSKKLAVMHGFAHGQNYAAETLRKYNVSCIVGHAHKIQVFTSPTVGQSGQQARICYGNSCLVPVKDVSYMTAPSGWTQGLTVALVDKKSGAFNVYPVVMTDHLIRWCDSKVYGPTKKGWIGK